MKHKQHIHIGTSGWHYDHWSGPFYPEDMNKEDFLAWYARHFHTVEINNTFYKMPDIAVLKKWRDTVNQGFLFATKGTRYITHMKKLKDPKDPVKTFLERVRILGAKMGPILFQLPPRWKANPDRLRSFFRTLSDRYEYAFEFRDLSWCTREVYDELEKHNAAFCMHDFDGRGSPTVVTADFIYVRLHGPEQAYKGRYTRKHLAGWVGAFSAWLNKVKDIYCYFNNDQAGYAVQNALEMQEMIQ